MSVRKPSAASRSIMTVWKYGPEPGTPKLKTTAS